ncbi:magnesium chelatase domain-containing protein, partial [uncultured Maritalea sp.]|uniref:magnesium chelatase domain-containing protein n=1 Tax=uncultured Maritalea sp. TaxID=757249 RepID=UPI00261394E2
MVTRVQTVAFQGIQALPVDVQVQVANGMPAFNIVGLPDKAVGESKERVRSALTSSGLSLPPKRITINLSPADLPKEGSHFDLPIALSLLAALDIIPADEIERTISLGELSLDGSLVPVIGALPAAMTAADNSARGSAATAEEQPFS